MKRLLDVVFSSVGLVVTSPLMIAAAVAVRATSDGPVLFKQARVGRSGRSFDILKFRSMAVRAESSTGLRLVTVGGDSRVTRVGAILRATKIDELPQLWNVLRGDMSLVGPRPEVPEYVELWDPSLRDIILSVRPGITDPASIAFRRESEMLERQEDQAAHYREVILPAKTLMYADYVRSRSLSGDLRILAATIVSVVKD